MTDWGEIYREHHQNLNSYCWRIAGDNLNGDDIEADTWVAAIASEVVPNEPIALLKFLAKRVRNKAITAKYVERRGLVSWMRVHGAIEWADLIMRDAAYYHGMVNHHHVEDEERLYVSASRWRDRRKVRLLPAGESMHGEEYRALLRRQSRERRAKRTQWAA